LSCFVVNPDFSWAASALLAFLLVVGELHETVESLGAGADENATEEDAPAARICHFNALKIAICPNPASHHPWANEMPLNTDLLRFGSVISAVVNGSSISKNHCTMKPATKGTSKT